MIGCDAGHFTSKYFGGCVYYMTRQEPGFNYYQPVPQLTQYYTLKSNIII